MTAPEASAPAAKAADAGGAEPSGAGAGTPETGPPDDAALLDGALKKTALIWIGAAAERTRPMWFLWSDGAIYLMTGGGEQAAPAEPGGTVAVIVRSKDKGVRLISFTATVEQVAAGEEWDRVAGQLHGKRLNSPDGDAALQRWARDAALLKLRPQLPLLEAPGRYDPRSHAAKPPATPANSKVPRPWHLFGRPQRNR